MTNEQRDELLINLSKQVSNLQECLIKNQKELQTSNKTIKKELCAELQKETDKIKSVIIKEFQNNTITTAEIFNSLWDQILIDILAVTK